MEYAPRRRLPRTLEVPMSLFLLALLGCTTPTPEKPAPSAEKTAEEPAAAPAAVNPQHQALFKPIQAPEIPADATAKIDLGRQLYYDPRLSLSQGISCNSCHQLDNYGVDNEPTSPGHGGARGERNSPSSYNAAEHVAQFWDGRAADLAAQAKGPILNPGEMAMPDEASVVKLLGTIPGYVEAFQAAYPTDGITYDNLANAIGTFETYLLTPSRFDKHLEGDASALTPEERAGLDLYVQTGCTTCHMGKYVGGQMYMKLGLVEPYPTEDEGRFKVTGNEADKFVFKVPSLRNVAKTAPYFHDGSVGTLEEAITLMAKHQLGKQLSADEVASIKTFLEALTGDIPTDYVKKPELPESGPETPGPQGA